MGRRHGQTVGEGHAFQGGGELFGELGGARAQGAGQTLRVKRGQHNGALVHDGVDLGAAGFHHKVCPLHANGSQGGVESEFVFGRLGRLTGDRPHHPLLELKTHLGIGRALRVIAVLFDAQGGGRAQTHQRAIDKTHMDVAVARGEQTVAHLQIQS